ncbi:MAG: PDZ domain-containing protein [bacterium]|nr:PDZ domain-containing protein [bacterium]
MTQRDFPKYLVIPLTLCAILYGAFLAKEKIEEKKAAAKLEWTDYSQAGKKAKILGKLVLIDFYSTLCMPCQKMDETTYRDSRVIELLKKEFILVKVDQKNWFNPSVKVGKNGNFDDSTHIIDGEDIAEQYHISSVPTVVIADSLGVEIGRVMGYREPETFIREIQNILKHKNPVLPEGNDIEGKGFLGVGFLAFDKDGNKGLEIKTIAQNSPAEQAGLQVGDIIVEVNEKTITEEKDLTKFIIETEPGQKLTFTILRENKKQKITTVLSELPDSLVKQRLADKAYKAYKNKNYKESAEIYEKVIQIKGNTDNGTFYDAACSFALAGNKDKAFEYLGKAVDNGYCNLQWMRTDTDLASLHKDPRFKKILRECRKAQKENVSMFLKEANIYKAGREWIYKGSFLDIKGKVTSSQSVTLKIPGGDFLEQQIKIRWSYEEGSSEETGVIDDSKEVWIHPPREGDFKFTELTAFPEIHKPFIKGKKWEGVLSIGKGWGKWEGLTIKNAHEIVGQKDVSNFTGCWQVDTKAESKEGIYKATFYFHPEYGFVRWEYTKPDSTKVILDLEKVSGF